MFCPACGLEMRRVEEPKHIDIAEKWIWIEKCPNNHKWAVIQDGFEVKVTLEQL